MLNIKRYISIALFISIFIVNISPTYASQDYKAVNKFYGINYNRLTQFFNRDINFNFKFGWDINKTDYANKVMKCIKCKKRIDMATYSFTRGYCENCYDGNKKALKQFMSAKQMLIKKERKVTNIKDYKATILTTTSAGILAIMYSMKNTVLGVTK